MQLLPPSTEGKKWPTFAALFYTVNIHTARQGYAVSKAGKELALNQVCRREEAEASGEAEEEKVETGASQSAADRGSEAGSSTLPEHFRQHGRVTPAHHQPVGL